MNQNFKRVLPTVFTGIALLFSFINLIFLIVLKDIAYIYTIAIIGLLIYAICKKKATLAAISISYFIFDYFIAGLKAFNQIFFAIFSDNEFKYGFNNFVEYNAHLLFFVTIALIVYDYFKKNKSI